MIAPSLRGSSTTEKTSRIYDLYNSAFDVIPADTPALLHEAYRIRHKVYCKENHYEQPEESELETDEFDHRSAHCLLYDRLNKVFLGTVRIILPSTTGAAQKFPFQRLTSNRLLTGRRLDILHTAAEISRFAISKEFRKVTHRSFQASSGPDKNLSRHITLGLFRGIVQMSMTHGITDWYAIMEPSLLRMLSKFGIYFMPIGPLVDYHGMRQPCYSDLHNLLERVRRERLDVWEVITDKGRLLSPNRSTVEHFCP